MAKVPMKGDRVGIIETDIYGDATVIEHPTAGTHQLVLIEFDDGVRATWPISGIRTPRRGRRVMGVWIEVDPWDIGYLEEFLKRHVEGDPKLGEIIGRLSDAFDRRIFNPQEPSTRRQGSEGS